MNSPTPPQMPEVIMVEPETLNACNVSDFNEESTRTNMLHWQPYTRTYLCDELRVSHQQLVEALKAALLWTDAEHDIGSFRKVPRLFSPKPKDYCDEQIYEYHSSYIRNHIPAMCNFMVG